MKRIEEKDIVFIINARAGKRRVEKILSELQKYSPGSTFIVTWNEKELAEIFSGQENRGKVYVAVGGDGTVRKVMEHILGTEHLLGIVPIGSGNGFARQVGIRGNIRDAVSILKYGEVVSVDIINVDGRNGINVAGLGFDAEVAYRFDRLGFRGFPGYIYSSIKALWCFDLFYAHISGQFIKEEGVYWMIAVANTGQYGNNARIAPQSFFDDGLMELVLVKPFPMAMLPNFLFRLFTASLKPSKYIKYIKTRGPVSISCTKTKLHIDGDPVDDVPVCITDERLDISLVPKAIQVILPFAQEKETSGLVLVKI